MERAMNASQDEINKVVSFLTVAFVDAMYEAQCQFGDYFAARRIFENTLREKHSLTQSTIDIYWRTMLAAYRLGAEDHMNGDYKP
jgi:hypothetical protein